MNFLLRLWASVILLCAFGSVYAQAPKAILTIKAGVAQSPRLTTYANSADGTTQVLSPPHIAYPTPQIYGINQPITPLGPVNTGGNVPATIYGEVSTVASGFSTVTGVEVDKAGTIYAADFDYHTIFTVGANGSRTLLTGKYTSGNVNGNLSVASFYQPDALATDPQGNIYVAEAANHQIRKIAPDGTVSTLAGNGESGTQDGTGAAARFYVPRGMALDKDGNLYVADQGNNLIRKITPAGVTTTYAGTGAYGLINGSRLSATFSTPTAVQLDAAGNVYVSDGGNNVIRKIATDGTVTTFATGFNFPREAEFDASGNLYVNDQDSHTVKKISPTGTVSTFAGTGASGYTNGARLSATFYQLIGMCKDADGNLLLGDQSAVRKITLSGYTIDKQLPAGLTFDPKTGIISGTPTALSAAQNYTITAYNGAGSHSTVVNIAVATTSVTTVLIPTVITMPPQTDFVPLPEDNTYDPKITSNNTESPITYTSSNPAVAYMTPDGKIKVVKPGVTRITASQVQSEHYTAGSAYEDVTIIEHLIVYLPPITAKTLCSADFNTNGIAGDYIFPLKYVSSNPTVATVDDNGKVHITGTGSVTITLSQPALAQYYTDAPPQSQTFNVTVPVSPSVSIATAQLNSCPGTPVVFTATPQNAGAAPKYQWQVNGVNADTNSATFTSSSVIAGDRVSCIINNTDNTCISTYTATSNTVTVTRAVALAPTVTIAASVNSVFEGTPITLTANVNGAAGSVINYQWFVNGTPAGTNSAKFTSSSFSNNDVVTCTVTLQAACSVPANSNQVKIVIAVRVDIPNTFTPNGDGINDKWQISGIGSYPNCLVNIYDRYGKIVYQSRGYANAWNGNIGSRAVPASTYYYVIELGSNRQVMSGYVTVIR